MDAYTECFIQMPGVYVCNPFMLLDVYDHVHVYMPAVKLCKLCCIICQVYIYIFRVFSCLCSVRKIAWF